MAEPSAADPTVQDPSAAPAAADAAPAAEQQQPQEQQPAAVPAAPSEPQPEPQPNPEPQAQPQPQLVSSSISDPFVDVAATAGAAGLGEEARGTLQRCVASGWLLPSGLQRSLLFRLAGLPPADAAAILADYAAQLADRVAAKDAVSGKGQGFEVFEPAGLGWPVDGLEMGQGGWPAHSRAVLLFGSHHILFLRDFFLVDLLPWGFIRFEPVCAGLLAGLLAGRTGSVIIWYLSVYILLTLFYFFPSCWTPMRCCAPSSTRKTPFACRPYVLTLTC